MPINEGITQKAIIDILLQKGSMEEPTLRREVKKSLNLKDDSSIRVHISKLNESRCITKGNTQPGKANTWEISYDNLKHTVNKFPDMDLKSNADVLQLISKRIKQKYAPEVKNIKVIENDGTLTEMNTETQFFSVLEFALKESESFFKASITTDFEELKKRWSTLFEIRLTCDDQYTRTCNDLIAEHSLPDIMLLKEAIFSYIRCDILQGVATQRGKMFATWEE